MTDSLTNAAPSVGKGIPNASRELTIRYRKVQWCLIEKEEREIGRGEGREGGKERRKGKREERRRKKEREGGREERQNKRLERRKKPSAIL